MLDTHAQASNQLFSSSHFNVSKQSRDIQGKQKYKSNLEETYYSVKKTPKILLSQRYKRGFVKHEWEAIKKRLFQGKKESQNI